MRRSRQLISLHESFPTWETGWWHPNQIFWSLHPSFSILDSPTTTTLVPWPYVWVKIDTRVKETQRPEATDRNRQIDHIVFAKGTSRTIFTWKSYALICVWIVYYNSSPAQSNAEHSLNNSGGFTFVILHLTLDAFWSVANILNEGVSVEEAR